MKAFDRLMGEVIPEFARTLDEKPLLGDEHRRLPAYVHQAGINMYVALFGCELDELLMQN